MRPLPPSVPSRRSAGSSSSSAEIPSLGGVPVTTPRSGEFIRQKSRFRGRPQGGPERHHLYVALACPWSQRAVIVRSVLGLGDALGISYLDPYRDERGWAFTGGRFRDDVNGFGFLAEAYEATVEDYDGRVSVPVLWDKEAGVVVNNESAEIVRILNAWAGGDLYPPEQADEIDELNAWIYSELQNGVYRAGFARSQEAYEAAYRGVFAALPRLEEHLADRRYLTGDAITEADWRLLPTLLRFDAVYHTHFRCNGARLLDFPRLLRYTKDLYEQPGVAETFALDEIKRHYYTTHDELNPKRIIPAGPTDLGFTA
jgi:glutathionyl-hydroquinone reductase